MVETTEVILPRPRAGAIGPDTQTPSPVRNSARNVHQRGDDALDAG